MNRNIVCSLAAGLLACGLAATPVRADNALFTFGEMRKLQELPLESAKREVSEAELLLYQNMEFYLYTVFESLLAANNAALMLHDEPLFCAPKTAFRFRDESDIMGLAAFVTEELLELTKEIGTTPERYHDRPASEVILLALRAGFPCERASVTASIGP